jgi:thiol-disulfide isomerase/thioredoxin
MSRTGRQIINTKKSAPLAQRRNTIAIASLVILAIVIIVAISLANRVPPAATIAPNATEAIKVGQTAPDFSVSTTSGPFELTKNGGKPTLLEVFATWCPHCQREVAVLNSLERKYGAQIAFVGVCGSPYSNPDTGAPSSQSDVLAFAQAFSVGYPIAFDPDFLVAQKYLKTGFPTIAIIDRSKTVTYIDSGEITESHLDAAIAAVLKR